MSSFKDKLERLHSSRQRARERADRDEAADGVFHAEDAAEHEHPPGDGDEETERTDDLESAKPAPYRLIHNNYDSDATHGATRLAALASTDLQRLLDRFLPKHLPRDIDSGEILFVDTETTGLDEEAYAFCVGWGWLDGDGFRLRHAVLESPDVERPMLRDVLELLESSQLLCTYNGANFDLPLLERRAAEHDLEYAIDEVPHLDLLPVTRSICEELSSHRLEDLERHLLDFHRHDDLPGSEVPDVWNRFQRTGEFRLLEPVVRHNRLDVASLCAGLGELARCVGSETRSNRRESDVSGRSDPEGPSEGGGRGEVSDRLARSYSLRSRGDTATNGVSRETNGTSESEPDGGTADTPHERVRQLRDQFDRMRAEEDREAAVEILYRIVAIQPGHARALEKLVDHHEERGEQELADHFRSRLRDVSPY